MGTPGLGHKSYLQFAPEVTYGTQLAATRKVELISWAVAPVIGQIPDPSLYNARSLRGLFAGGILYRGTFTVRANYDGLVELFRGVMGATGYTSAVVDTTARNHTLKESLTLKSYTFEAVVGDIPVGKCFDLVGSYLTDMRFRIGVGLGPEAMGQIEFGVLAKDYVSNQTPAVLTFPLVKPVLFHQAVTVDDGTADPTTEVRVRSLEVSIRNPLADDRFYLGSKNIDQPLPNDFLDVLWRIESEFQTRTLFDAAQAFTLSSPQVVFRNTVLAGATTAYHELELRSNSANIVEHGAPVEGFGIIKQTNVHRAWQDAGDLSALVLRNQNIDSALP